MWETDGEAAREEQGAGEGTSECGVRRRLAKRRKLGCELENFPRVETPPLHFEGIRPNKMGTREAQSQKGILTGGDFREGLCNRRHIGLCLYHLLTVLVGQALNKLEPTCSSESEALSHGTGNAVALSLTFITRLLGSNIIFIHD